MKSLHAIRILRMTHLRGPNIWTYRPVIEAWVDIGDLEDRPSNTLPGFNQRLAAWLPGLVEHRCSVGERGGFLKRLNDGTWAAHIMEHVALELQTQAGLKTGFGKAREAGVRGIYKIAIRARHPDIGKAALTAARDLILAAIHDQPFDVPATIDALKAMADRLCLGPSTACIVDAATDRGIPHLRLNDGNLVQLGHGVYQRRIWTAETDRTSAIAEGISRDKELTKELLSTCGVPVPAGQAVESAEEAWEAAQDLGGAVVVKPQDGNHARGVSLNLTTRAEVEDAYAIAAEEGSGVLVERFIPGMEHRLLVVGDKVVAVTRGAISSITGDGQSTVLELVNAQINTDPRRGEEESFPLDTIRLPENRTAMLELLRQGHSDVTVPKKGEVVVVERIGNLTHDVTGQVHPDVAQEAALAARIVGLDIAGIDLVTTNISRPLQETGGAIVEVNAGPGLLMHLKPASGEVQPVGQAIVQHLMPRPDKGRIPLVGVLGEGAGATLAARLTATLLHSTGLETSLACADGLFLGTRQVERQDARTFDHGERVLMNRTAEAGVIETSARQLLAEGLAYDRCRVGVVTHMPAPLGLDEFYITRAEQMPHIVRTQVDVVLAEGAAVLNADDAEVAALASLCDGAVVLYSRDANLPALMAHRLQGARVVFLRAGQVWLASGEHEHALLPLADVHLDAINPQHLTGADLHSAVLAAVAALWALGVDADLLRANLQRLSHEQAPRSATPATA